MVVRIPTGVSYIHNLESVNFVSFTCPYCRQYAIEPFIETACYSLDSRIKKYGGRDVYHSEKEATDIIRYKQLQYVNQFNQGYDYSVVERPINCPFCKQMQPWSQLTKKDIRKRYSWKISVASMLSFLVLFFGLVLSLFLMSKIENLEDESDFIYKNSETLTLFIFLGIFVAALIINFFITKQTEKKIMELYRAEWESGLASYQKIGFPRPIIYNSENIAEIQGTPVEGFVMSYLQSKK